MHVILCRIETVNFYLDQANHLQINVLSKYIGLISFSEINYSRKIKMKTSVCKIILHCLFQILQIPLSQKSKNRHQQN